MLEPRDRALARLIAATVLRRVGELEAVLNSFLEKPLPKQKGALWPILLSGAAQLLFLETPPHAAIGLAVDQARRDRHAHRFDKLVNAVLRRVSREGAAALQGKDAVALNMPAWLLQRWTRAYGADAARRSRRPRSPRRRSTSASRMRPQRGPSGSAGMCCRRDRCGSPPAAASRICPAMPTAHGGCRTRRRHCRCACSARSPANRSSICARRRAARRRSSPRPAPM